MSSGARGWRRGVLLLLSLAMGAGGWLGLQQSARADEATRVLLLLDVSGSMNERISSGGTKFAAAKRALKQVADALPAGTQVGLRVYGSKIAEPKSQNPRACTDTELVLPIAPLDSSRMDAAVDSFAAKGETPIAYSMQKAVADLGPSGKRVLVLISDGQETCKADPCPTARKLAQSGVDLQFNAIGLAVNAKARRQLKCIADAGDGNYYDVANTPDLSSALEKITQRALRPFQISGTPVDGTVSAADAPGLTPGQYRDAYDPDRIPRYYRITRTPGSTVTASVASIVRSHPAQNTEFWKLTLSTPDGTECSTNTISSSAYHATTVVSGAVRSAPSGPPTGGSPGSACGAGPLLLSLSRYSPLGNTMRVGVEIRLAEEPAIDNLASLPKGLSSYSGTGDAVRATKPVRPILGGTSFSNAAIVTPGSFSDSLATGETLYYRVRLEPGQRVRVSAHTPAPGTAWRLGSADAITTRVALLSPARVKMTEQSANLQGAGALLVTAVSPEVRVRNRETPMPPDGNAPNQWSTASISGDYFVALQVDPLGRDLTGRVMQVQLDVAVDGKVVGQAQYAEQTTSPSPTEPPSPTPGASPSGNNTASPSPETNNAAPVGLAVGAGFALAMLLVGGALWWQRRRGRT